MEPSRLQVKYEKEIRPTLMSELNIKNQFAVPKLQKVVLNVGLGEALDKPEVAEKVQSYLGLIAGQRPTVRKAKKSIAGFKLREGQVIGVAVTLRGKRMYDFTDKFFSVVLPRVRDFHGLSNTSFDGKGNYSVGLNEQTVFPEIDYTNIDKIRGMQITFVSSSTNKEQAKRLLELLGLPFKKA